jgi:hypothetical protein
MVDNHSSLNLDTSPMPSTAAQTSYPIVTNFPEQFTGGAGNVNVEIVRCIVSLVAAVRALMI